MAKPAQPAQPAPSTGTDAINWSRVLCRALDHCWRGLLLCLLAWPLTTAQAATYSFRSDSYNWETAATAITWDRTCTSFPSDDDKAKIGFSGGFSFKFAGVAYGSVFVLSNGGLAFVDSGFHRSYSNTTLPAGTPAAASGCATAAPTQLMLAYWADLNPGAAGSGGVSWEQKGVAPNRYVVVSWNAVYQYSTSTPYTFQIILFENGDFKYQYGNANASGTAATIGVQVNASDYTLYSYNSGYAANGSAIRWSIPSSTPSRVAEYRMDELSWNGTVGEVADSSGNNHAGVRVGLASNVASGYVCRALSVPANINTTVAAIDTALDVDTGIGASGSVSLWVNSNVAWSSATPAIVFDATIVANRAFYLMRAAGGALKFVATDSAGTALTATTAALNFGAGTWQHVAVTWRLAAGSNQTTLRIYVNGVMQVVTIGTTSGALDSSLGSLFLGDNRSAATPSGGTANSLNGLMDEVRIYNYEVSAAELALDMAVSHSCAPPLHHLELRHGSGSGLTCTPSTLSLVACQDAACSAQYTGGVSGTLSASGTGMTMNWPDTTSFSIPAGSGSVNWRIQQTTVGSMALATSGVAPAPSSAASCNFGSPACNWTAADAGFIFSVPNHVAELVQTVRISAVRKSDSSLACTPAFAIVSKAVTLKCGYTNPASGTLPLRVGGSALNAAGNASAACDLAGKAVSLVFDATGLASTTLQYADVGQMLLSASYSGSALSGDAGLVMAGSSSFIAAPASFAFSAISVGPIKAGAAFSVSLSARNSAAASTANFGRESSAESVNLSFIRAAPGGVGASNGVFSGALGSFSGGTASGAGFAWSEVGSGDLSAVLASGSYLGSGLTAVGLTGTGGSVGSFIPDHFDVSVVPACAGSFSYAGQPFSASITARNAAGATTLNYDGSAKTAPNQAKPVTLSDANGLGLGSLSGASLAASAFSAGVASANPSYAFTLKLTAPQTLKLRAVDTATVSSSGFSEGSTPLRSGRLRLSSAFGLATAALQVPMAVDYWSGNAWLLNSADTCSSVPAAAVALSNPRNFQGNALLISSIASAVSLAGGSGLLSLAVPAPASSGVTFDLALNLGSTGLDQSCQANHPVTVGAGLAWLRSYNGACNASPDRDPAARVSFGIFSPETRKTVHVRDLF